MNERCRLTLLGAVILPLAELQFKKVTGPLLAGRFHSEESVEMKASSAVSMVTAAGPSSRLLLSRAGPPSAGPEKIFEHRGAGGALCPSVGLVT